MAAARALLMWTATLLCLFRFLVVTLTLKASYSEQQ